MERKAKADDVKFLRIMPLWLKRILFNSAESVVQIKDIR